MHDGAGRASGLTRVPGRTALLESDLLWVARLPRGSRPSDARREGRRSIGREDALSRHTGSHRRSSGSTGTDDGDARRPQQPRSDHTRRCRSRWQWLLLLRLLLRVRLLLLRLWLRLRLLGSIWIELKELLRRLGFGLARLLNRRLLL